MRISDPYASERRGDRPATTSRIVHASGNVHRVKRHEPAGLCCPARPAESRRDALVGIATAVDSQPRVLANGSVALAERLMEAPWS